MKKPNCLKNYGFSGNIQTSQPWPWARGTAVPTSPLAQSIATRSKRSGGGIEVTHWGPSKGTDETNARPCPVGNNSLAPQTNNGRQ